MYREGSIPAYIAAACQGTPTPGGGSISAMVAALGTTMATMAGNFTVGREKFAAAEPEVVRILADLERTREELLKLVDEDVEAYGVVSGAYGMPRKTEEEKKARRTAIQKALMTATEAPLRTMRACAVVLKGIARLVDLSNPNLTSDVGVAAIAVEAGLAGARLNVEVNLAAMKDAGTVARIRQEIIDLACEATALRDQTVAKVERGTGSHG